MSYFTIEELCKSATATKLGLDNTPTATEKKHLQELIDKLLDPLRIAWGSPIIVTSGFRSFKLNTAVKGSKTSAHSRGYAGDLVPSNGNIKEFKEFVRNWLKNGSISWDQYIEEKNSSGSEWCHLSLYNSTGGQRKQFLEYKNGKYTTLKV